MRLTKKIEIQMVVETIVMVIHTTFSNIYIVAASFIGRGNRSTQRKLPTCCKSLTHLITQAVVNPTTMRSRPRRLPVRVEHDKFVIDTVI